MTRYMPSHVSSMETRVSPRFEFSSQMCVRNGVLTGGEASHLRQQPKKSQSCLPVKTKKQTSYVLVFLDFINLLMA